ncbi:unnamed protein product, partial [Ceratitis capitata]
PTVVRNRKRIDELTRWPVVLLQRSHSHIRRQRRRQRQRQRRCLTVKVGLKCGVRCGGNLIADTL